MANPVTIADRPNLSMCRCRRTTLRAAAVTSSAMVACQARCLRRSRPWHSSSSSRPMTMKAVLVRLAVRVSAPGVSAATRCHRLCAWWSWWYRPALTPATMKKTPTSSIAQPASLGTQRLRCRRSGGRSPPAGRAAGGWARRRVTLPAVVAGLERAPPPGPWESVISDMRVPPRVTGHKRSHVRGPARRDGLRAGLAHAAHGHAQMLGLHHYDNAPGFQDVHQRIGDLAGHPLLHLGAPGVDVHQPGQLRQPRDLPLLVGDVPHVGVPVKRRQMVLAGREDLDVADQHHLVVIGVEHGAEHRRGILPQPGELLGERPGHPPGRVPQAVPARVLADGDQDLPYRPLDPGEIDLVAAQRGAPPRPSSPRMPMPNGSSIGPGRAPPNPPGRGPGAWPLPPRGSSAPSGAWAGPAAPGAPAAVSASSFGVSTGGRSDGIRLPYPV